MGSSDDVLESLSCHTSISIASAEFSNPSYPDKEVDSIYLNIYRQSDHDCTSQVKPLGTCTATIGVKSNICKIK